MFVKIWHALLVFLMFSASSSVFAATILNNSYTVTAIGITTVSDSSPSDPAIATSMLTSGLGTAEATASPLIITNPNADPDSFQFTGTDFASAFVDRDNGAGNVETIGTAIVEYTISFELAPNEIATATFDLDFSIDQTSNQDSSVVWSLAGPDPDSTTITGNETAEVTNGSSGTQTAVLNTAGIYTLTISAVVPEQDFGSNDSASASLDTLTFTVISVPEPSSLMMVAVGLVALIWRRK